MKNNKKMLKFLAVLLSAIIISSSSSLTFAVEKNYVNKSQIVENLNNNNKEKQVENYVLKNVLKKNNGELLIYEHEKSGAIFLISSNLKKGPFYSGVHFKFLANKNNVGVAHALEHVLFSPTIKKIEDVHNIPEKALPMFLNFYATGGAQTPYYNAGSGFNLQVNTFTPEIVDIISKEIQNPTFLNDGRKTFNTEKKRISLEMGSKESSKAKKCDEIEKERFLGGMFNNGGGAEKIKYKQLKKEFKKNVIPANCLISFSKDRNPNYKEIMKQFDEKWFKNFKKPKNTNLNKNLNSLVQTSPQREIKCEKYDWFKEYNPKTDGGDPSKEPKDLKSKFKARLIWNLKNLTPEQKDVFRMNEQTFKVLFEEKIKKMGYDLIEINNQRNATEFDPITFDEKFFIDFYGSNKENFKKEVLKKNAKELLTSFYEYLNNALNKKDKASKGALYYTYLPFPMHSDINDLGMYRGNSLQTYIEKSFELSNNPISEKYFNIKNEEILSSPNEIIKNIEKNKDVFKILINNPPNYVDTITFLNGKNSEKLENNVEKRYEFPLNFNCFSKAGSSLNDEDKEQNLKEKIKAQLIENILYKKFLYPNLHEKGLVYATNLQINRNEILINQKEYEDVKKYLLKDFKKEVKNYKPSSEEISKLKKNYIKNLNYMIEFEKRLIKEKENLLNEKVKLKNKIEDEEIVEILDALTEFKKQNNFKPVGWHKTLLEKGAKKIIEERKKGLTAGINEEVMHSKKEIAELKELIKEVEKINYEDILKEFENAKFSEISQLKEIKNENNKNKAIKLNA